MCVATGRKLEQCDRGSTYSLSGLSWAVAFDMMKLRVCSLETGMDYYIDRFSTIQKIADSRKRGIQ